MINTNVGSTTTYFVGNYYEVTGTSITKYYYAGSQRIAMRKNGVLNYIIGDYLGSTSLVTDASGNVVSQQQYKAWGETRYSSGSEVTKYQYTGQYSYESDFGLQFYNVRWYDSSLGRFAQADTIVPDGVQGYDRYAYVNNSPINYIDPSGYDPSHNNCDYAGLCDANGNSLPIQTTVPVPSGGGGVNNEPPLTHAGDQAITEYGETFTRRIGGAEIYDIYIGFRDNCGWWNNNCSSNFGVEEFIGMYFLFESNSNETVAGILSTITAQNLYVGGFNPPSCNIGGQCFNAVFNFIAANIDGGSALLAGSQNLSNQIYDKNAPSNLGGAAGIRNTISTLGQNALSPSSVITWDRFSGPSSWGNSDPWRRALIADQIWEDKFHGLSQDTVYYYIGNAIFYSVDQYNYWKGKIK